MLNFVQYDDPGAAGVSWVYAHNEAENVVEANKKTDRPELDLVGLKGVPRCTNAADLPGVPAKGITACTLYGVGALLVTWPMAHQRNKTHGLICLTSDQKAIDYAIECMESEKSSI